MQRSFTDHGGKGTQISGVTTVLNSTGSEIGLPGFQSKSHVTAHLGVTPGVTYPFSTRFLICTMRTLVKPIHRDVLANIL